MIGRGEDDSFDEGGGAFLPAAHHDRLASCPSHPCTLGIQTPPASLPSSSISS